MDSAVDRQGEGSVPEQNKLLQTLQSLLEIEATEVKGALERASDLVSSALNADKVDVFLCDPSSETLVAVGVSKTPMGTRQREIGLDRLPLANGGRTAEVFRTGTPYVSGHAEDDPGVLVGVKQGLGVRSMMLAPLTVDGERRGVVSVTSEQSERYSERDLHFLEAVSHWIGMMVYRAELVERIAQDATEQGRRVAAEELVTVLAHDLANFLTPLKGRLHLIRRSVSRDQRTHDVHQADEALRVLDRVERLVHDLLDAGRLEQGLFVLSPQPADLAVLVRETVEAVRTPETKIHVRAPESLTAHVDPARVSQALHNLLTNAIKYSPQGIPIAVDVREEPRADGRVAVIEVRDEGPGISPELQQTIFRRFRPGPGSTGLGLGLYLARGIAEAHGGTLTVESTPGKGSTFRLSLPLLLDWNEP